jgi:hypothetical protein
MGPLVELSKASVIHIEEGYGARLTMVYRTTRGAILKLLTGNATWKFLRAGLELLSSSDSLEPRPQQYAINISRIPTGLQVEKVALSLRTNELRVEFTNDIVLEVTPYYYGGHAHFDVFTDSYVYVYGPGDLVAVEHADASDLKFDVVQRKPES